MIPTAPEGVTKTYPPVLVPVTSLRRLARQPKVLQNLAKARGCGHDGEDPHPPLALGVLGMFGAPIADIGLAPLVRQTDWCSTVPSARR